MFYVTSFQFANQMESPIDANSWLYKSSVIMQALKASFNNVKSP